MQKNATKAFAQDEIDAYHRHIGGKWMILLSLVLLTVFFMLMAINSGSAQLNPLDIIKIIFGYGNQKKR